MPRKGSVVIRPKYPETTRSRVRRKSTRARSAPNECHAGPRGIDEHSDADRAVLRIGAIAHAYTAVLSVATHTGMWTGQMIRLTKSGSVSVAALALWAGACPPPRGAKCALPDRPVIGFCGRRFLLPQRCAPDRRPLQHQRHHAGQQQRRAEPGGAPLEVKAESTRAFLTRPDPLERAEARRLPAFGDSRRV